MPIHFYCSSLKLWLCNQHQNVRIPQLLFCCIDTLVYRKLNIDIFIPNWCIPKFHWNDLSKLLVIRYDINWSLYPFLHRCDYASYTQGLATSDMTVVLWVWFVSIVCNNMIRGWWSVIKGELGDRSDLITWGVRSPGARPTIEFEIRHKFGVL